MSVTRQIRPLGKVSAFTTLLSFTPNKEKELRHLFESNYIELDWIKPTSKSEDWDFYRLLCMFSAWIFSEDFDGINFIEYESDGEVDEFYYEDEKKVLNFVASEKRNAKDLYSHMTFILGRYFMNKGTEDSLFKFNADTLQIVKYKKPKKVKKLKLTIGGVPFKIPFILIDSYFVKSCVFDNWTISFGLVVGGELTLRVDDYEGTIRQLKKYFKREK